MDPDDLEDDPPNDVIPGQGGGDEGNMLAELLLELQLQTNRARTLLEEADEGEFKAVAHRYRAFLNEVERLPSGPRPRSTVGFKVPTKKRKAPKKRDTRPRGPCGHVGRCYCPVF